MVFSIKFAIILAAGAAAVSGFAGILGGVDAFTLIVRMLFGAAVFFGLSAGGELLLRRFLPELFEEGASFAPKAEPEDDVFRDSSVDITLGEDDDAEEPAGRAASEPREDFGDNEFIEEVEEADSGSPSVEFEGLGDADGDIEELPNLDRFASSFESVTVDDEEDAFVDEDAGETFSSRGSASSARGGHVDMLGMEASPDDVARAVRTILKKDQEG